MNSEETAGILVLGWGTKELIHGVLVLVLISAIKMSFGVLKIMF